MNNNHNALLKALEFIENIDVLKKTYRQCLIMSGDRQESTAEHSFSLAMSVLVLAQFSEQPIDIVKTLKMALFHDLAEAILGDTFHYNKDSATSNEPQLTEEEALHKLLTPIVDTELAYEILSLWKEFEFSKTPEAVFLRGLDRFLPMYHNYKTQGHSWVKHGITQEMALSKNAHIQQSSELLWKFTQNMLNESKKQGWIN